MRLSYMKSFKIMVVTGLLGLLFFLTGKLRVGAALIVAAGILFVITFVLWLKWLLNL